MDTLQALLELTPGKKFTFVHFDQRGWPAKLKFTLSGTYMHRKGYKNYVALDVKPKANTTRTLFINPDNQFSIWNDSVDPDVNIMISTYLKDSGHGVLKMARSWARFDSRYIQKAIDSVPEKPVVWNIKAAKPETLHDLCYVID